MRIMPYIVTYVIFGSADRTGKKLRPAWRWLPSRLIPSVEPLARKTAARRPPPRFSENRLDNSLFSYKSMGYAASLSKPANEGSGKRRHRLSRSFGCETFRGCRRSCVTPWGRVVRLSPQHLGSSWRQVNSFAARLIAFVRMIVDRFGSSKFLGVPRLISVGGSGCRLPVE